MSARFEAAPASAPWRRRPGRPGFLRGVDDRGGDARHPGELGPVLRGQLVAMRQHAGLRAAADHLAGDRREHDGLARPVGATPSVLPWEASAATLRSTKVFWRGRRRMAGPPSLRPGRPTGGAGGGRGLAAWVAGAGLLRGMALRRGGGERGATVPHQRGVVRWSGVTAPRISFLSSPLVSVPMSMRATNSTPSRSAKPLMRRRACASGELSLSDIAARRVQHAADQAAAHVGPVRALRAVEADQREDLAPGIGPFEHRELAVEIDGAGRAAAWHSRRSSPARGRRSRRGGSSGAPWRACPSGSRWCWIGVVEVVPGSGHGRRLLSVGGWDAQRRRGKATPATGSGHRAGERRSAMAGLLAGAGSAHRRPGQAFGSSPSAGRDAAPRPCRGGRAVLGRKPQGFSVWQTKAR
jgi:hypothetical protein